jgi:hypothetical protein
VRAYFHLLLHPVYRVRAYWWLLGLGWVFWFGSNVAWLVARQSHLAQIVCWVCCLSSWTGSVLVFERTRPDRAPRQSQPAEDVIEGEFHHREYLIEGPKS